MNISQDLAIGLALGFLLGMVVFARWRRGIGFSPIGCLMDAFMGLLLMGLGLVLLVVGGYVEVG